MKGKYYPASVMLLEAHCDTCGGILRFVRFDVSKDPLCWLHACDICGRSYWLDNKYPYPAYSVDTAHPLNIEAPAIKGEESK